MRQDRRRFVEQLDYLTTPGYLDGPGARERAGLPAGTGPHRVITQLGVYGFDEACRRMILLAAHPGVVLDEIQSNSSFDLLISDDVGVTEPPPPRIRRILREIDPTAMVIPR
jgi:acyl CoA:acetate/3-ketoacid CoA transferase beta subunit